MRKRAAIAAITLTALTGCSEQAEADQPEPATVGQYASVIARHQATIAEAADSLCYITIGLADTDADTEPCIEDAKETRAAVRDIRDKLRVLGEPPAEISELVTRMTNVSTELLEDKEADSTWHCSEPRSEECQKALVNIYAAATVINDEIAAWQPYL